MQKTQFAPKNFFFVKHAQLAVSVGARDVGAEVHRGLLLLVIDVNQRSNLLFLALLALLERDTKTDIAVTGARDAMVALS